MGSSSSSDTEPRRRVGVVMMGERNPEILQRPWRRVVWDHSTKTNLRRYVRDYRPIISSVPQARILLIGAVGAGKSSFFNSINSIFRRNITSQATAGYQDTSLTLQYRTYRVRAGRGGRPLSFLLCDTMGLEPTPNGGVNPEDIVSILKAYIPEEYRLRTVCLIRPQQQLLNEYMQFNPVQPMKYQACSTLAVKCGVCDGQLITWISAPRDKEEDVLLLVLLTKVDRACPLVENDLKTVYYSCYIKDLIEKASRYLGIAESNVIPVKNYSYETELNDACDILLLSALKQMLNFADNYLDNFD